MPKALITSAAVTHRDPKGSHTVNLFEAAYDSMKLEEDQAQRLNENGGAFQDDLKEIIRKHSATNQFADEEVESTYGYLSGYEKPKGITEQTNILRQLISGVGYADEKIARQDVPEGAEGWFAIPDWRKVAPTYGEAVQKVLDLIKQQRDGRFYNYREGQLGPDQLRESDKTAKAFQQIAEDQKGHDIMVVAAQFGIRHRGRSVRRAREVMNSREFGLGAFAIGIMLLTHPERLKNYDDLWTDCAGDEFSVGDGVFDEAPCLSFDDDEVEFGTHMVGYAFEDYGSASAFLPQ